jgi:hypothetical protein
MRLKPILALAVVLAAAGCGGGDGRDAGDTETRERKVAPRQPAERDRELAEAFSDEGWETNFGRLSVPLSEFLSGGPPKDGIPAIDEPKFEPVASADDWLSAREPVIELEVQGQVKAYPIQILIWHEIVNDTIAATPVSVTFCPLCNTAIVFDRRVRSRRLSFGTTGKLRNSDLVMYDRQTESWWQQFGGEGVVGRYTGEKLKQLPAQVVSWAEFRRMHPEGAVLSRETGHSRPYGENPYAGYDDVDSPPFFPARNSDDDRLPPKERVVYVERGREAVAIPFSVLRSRKELEVEVGGDTLTVRWRGGVASALDADEVAGGRDVGAADVLLNGRRVPFDQPFWFAVASFRPDIRIVR